MQLWVGTSGYSYKEWKGSFYPEKLPAAKMLQHYAEQLPSVEINNTFYRLPRVSVLEAWVEQVPDDFRFVIKASRRITHLKRLKDAGDETEYLFTALESLESRLGAVLFQLPPNLKMDLERLDAFLDLLPRGRRIAFEFRHETWFDDAVLGRLRDHECALVTADTDDEGPVAEAARRLEPTASWGYVRLRRGTYTDDEVAAWADRIRDTGWEGAFVFFKHEGEGSAPALAATMRTCFDG
jgi:uncharacterized protein YecE (DUF72 family)